MKNQNGILETRNREWGFSGTCVSNGRENPDLDWDQAMAFLTDPKSAFRLDPSVARDLLDAPFGRHLADECGPEDVERREAVDLEVERLIPLARLDPLADRAAVLGPLPNDLLGGSL